MKTKKIFLSYCVLFSFSLLSCDNDDKNNDLSLYSISSAYKTDDDIAINNEAKNETQVIERVNSFSPYDETKLFEDKIPIGATITKIEVTTNYQMYFAGVDINFTNMNKLTFDKSTYLIPQGSNPVENYPSLEVLEFIPSSEFIYNGEDLLFWFNGQVVVPNHSLDYKFTIYYN